MFTSLGRTISSSILSISLIACGGDNPDTYFSGSSGGSTSATSTTSSTNTTSTTAAINLDKVNLESHIAETDSFSRLLSISDDGNTILLFSDSDLVPGSNSVAKTLQAFTLVGGVFTQITNFAAASISSDRNKFSFSGDASTLVWISPRDLVGNNPLLNSQIFSSDMAGNITQLTNSTGFISRVAISSDASLITFISDADFLGSNSNNTPQVFTLNTTTLAVTQLTFSATSTGAVFGLEISGDGSRIAFVAAGDWIQGSNPNNLNQVFTIKADGSDFVQQTTEQLGGVTNFLTVKINKDGSVIAFSSAEDYTGQNPDNDLQLFSVETANSAFHQLSRSSDSISNDSYDISENTVFYSAGSPMGILSVNAINPNVLTPTVVMRLNSVIHSSLIFNLSPLVVSDNASKIVWAFDIDIGLTVAGEDIHQVYSIAP